MINRGFVNDKPRLGGFELHYTGLCPYCATTTEYDVDDMTPIWIGEPPCLELKCVRFFCSECRKLLEVTNFSVQIGLKEYFTRLKIRETYESRGINQ